MGHSQFYSYIVEDSKKSSFIEVRFVVSENTSTKDCFIYILMMMMMMMMILGAVLQTARTQLGHRLLRKGHKLGLFLKGW